MSARRDWIVEVTWVDSCSYNRWAHRDDHESHGPSECKSVGYLIAKDRKSLRISQNMADGDKCDSTMAIPMGCVKRVRRIGRSLA